MTSQNSIGAACHAEPTRVVSRTFYVGMGVTPLAFGLFILAILFGGRASAAPGDLDVGFNGTGVLHNYTTYFTDVIVLSDGRLVVTRDGLLAPMQYLPNGQPDLKFGTNGAALFRFPDKSTATAIEQQADGKLVLAGDLGSGASQTIAVARYLPDGSPDIEFGFRGVATATGLSNSHASAVKVLPNGNILVAGSTGLATSPGESVLIRFTASGVRDPTFGVSGVVRAMLGRATAMAVQPDGKILVSGLRTDRVTYFLARFLADGTLDASFGSGGLVTETTGVFSWNNGKALALQQDGRILLGVDDALLRYRSDGVLDTTFGSGGRTVPLKSFVKDVSVAASGKIIVAGAYSVAVDGIIIPEMPYVPVIRVVRCNVDGSLDPTFGASGSVDGVYLYPARDLSMTIQNDGLIVVAASGLARLQGDPSHQARGIPTLSTSALALLGMLLVMAGWIANRPSRR